MKTLVQNLRQSEELQNRYLALTYLLIVIISALL